MVIGKNWNDKYWRSIVLNIINTVLLILFVLFILNLISREVDLRLYNAASVISERYSLEISEIIPHLLEEKTTIEQSLGQNLLNQYGYDQRPLLSKPVIHSVLVPLTAILCIYIFLTQSLFWINEKIIGMALKERFSELNNAVASLLEGHFHQVPSSYHEGLFHQFTTKFNQMVRKFESQTERLAKEKHFLREIISDISHQLKTPLSSLIMYNELMLEDIQMDSKQREDFLHYSKSQLNRMEWLIISLLKMARLETGSIVFHKRSMPLESALHEALESVQHLKGRRAVQIDDQRVVQNPIEADGNWLSEAFANILKNAYEHTDESRGIINITLRDTALFARLIIQDNGPGISSEDEPRIFERFYKGSHSSSMESVGIGLPLSRMIITSHGGDIRISDSSFVITIPY